MLALDDCRLMVDESINQPPDAPRTSVIYLYPDDLFAYHRDVRRRGLDVRGGSRHRHGRVDSRTIRLLRNRGDEADLWPGEPLGDRGLCIVFGPSGADDEDGAGCGDLPAGDGGA